MSQYDEYTNPSQAEGERLDEDLDAQQKAQIHPQVSRTTPPRRRASGWRTRTNGSAEDGRAGRPRPA
ncbi:hypothetical protein AB6O49_30845 [Streptomyces sp. SBR177]